MNYPESVRFLYALGNEIKTAKLGLERIGTLLSWLGHPERASNIVHVAGTNGKGSTCAMIESGLRAAGLRTGLFTSPHLSEPTERITIAGQTVTSEQFTAAFDKVHTAAEELLAIGRIDAHPTYFETVTAMAFVLFRELGVQIAVVEVGLGGRLDATNVVHPILCVITPIDYDHEQYLGTTLESIATEKAGILKPGIPAIFARQRPEADHVLNARAAELGVTATCAADFEVRDLEIDARGSRFSVGGMHIMCPLAGEHQVQNAVTAALALKHLGVAVRGIAWTRWPGRLEHVSDEPEIILDGAHNPAGARALAAYIKRFYEGRKVWLIYGSMRDKAIEEIAGVLFPLASEIVATAPHFARALRPEALREFAVETKFHAAESVEDAIALVRAEAHSDDVIFITGSLYVVGEARALLVK